MNLGVALAWHVHPWEVLLDLVQRAESLGYAAVFVDGDVSMLARRPETDVLDGWTTTVALLARTDRIPIGSMRLVEHWNPARLAQAVASVDRITPGRLRFKISIGDWETDARFGYPRLPVGERIQRLDEMLDALRALWRGETVTRAGHHVRLDRARVRPTPGGGRIPIAVSARRPRMLGLVARHADIWDVNLPPVASRVLEAAGHLEAACEGAGRDPSTIGRSMWIFTRIRDEGRAEEPLAEFRRLNPWFGDLTDPEARGALVTGNPAACRARLREIAREFSIDLPVIDLSGLEASASRRCLEALAPANNCVDAET